MEAESISCEISIYNHPDGKIFSVITDRLLSTFTVAHFPIIARKHMGNRMKLYNFMLVDGAHFKNF